MSGNLSPVRSRTITRQDDFDPAEWDARVELAALYRAVARFGMTDLTYNHITYRCPGDEETFLINAYGMWYSEVTASSFYKVDIDGKVLWDPGIPYASEVNPAVFVLHGSVHAARPDVRCVMHTHTRASTAVSAQKGGLLPISQHATRYHRRLSYHDYMGPAVNAAECEIVVRNLGSNNAMLLRNHGTLVCGPTIAETFLNAYYLEQACKIQIDAMSGGAELQFIPEDVLDLSVQLLDGRLTGEREWAAILRLLSDERIPYAV